MKTEKIPKVINDRILAIEQTAKEETKTGLILSNEVLKSLNKDTNKTLLVKGIGEDVKNVKVGDIINVSSHCDNEVVFNNVKYLIVRPHDINFIHP